MTYFKNIGFFYDEMETKLGYERSFSPITDSSKKLLSKILFRINNIQYYRKNFNFPGQQSMKIVMSGRWRENSNALFHSTYEYSRRNKKDTIAMDGSYL